jgi:predicted dehydrogenase
MIDLTRHLLGDFEAVSGMTRTYVETRPTAAGSEKREAVDVDDAAWVQVILESGASGTLFVTRFATGAVDDLNVQIYGERGGLKFSLQDGNVLQRFDADTDSERQGWTRNPTGTQYHGAVVPPPRGILGWNRTHAENLYQFLRAVVESKPFTPDLTDGVCAHQVIDAVYESAATRAWISFR